MIDHNAMKNQPQIDIFTKFHFAEGLVTKEMHIPAGVTLGKHVHTYSHQSILAKGQIILHKGDEVAMLHAPVVLEVTAGVEHAVEALTDTVWYCVHNSDYAEKDAAFQENH